MPTLSVFFRKENYEALRKAEEKTDRTIGNLLNQLVKDHLQEVAAQTQKGSLRRTHQT